MAPPTRAAHPTRSTQPSSRSNLSSTSKTVIVGRDTGTAGTPAASPGPNTPLTITTGPSTSSLTTTGVTISWSLSAVGTGYVEYGLTTSYGNETAHETSFSYSSHAQTITGLTPGTTYHYRVRSTSQQSVETVSTDSTFTTSSSALVFPTVLSQPAKGPMPSPWSVPAQNAAVTVTDFTGTCRITRISDVTTYYMTYPVLQSWNSDDSYFAILSGANAGGFRLYSGTYPYNLVRTFTFGTSVNAPIWSGSNPDKMYGLHQAGNWIRYYTPSTNTTTLLRTFTSYTKVWAGDSSTIGDNDMLLLKAQKSNGSWWIIWYNASTDTIVSETQFNHPSNGANYEMKNVHTSRSGTYGLVTYGAAGGVSSSLYAIYQVDQSMNVIRNLFGVGANGAPHMAPGTVNSSNNDCVVYFPGYMRDLVTNATTDLFPYVSNKNDLTFQHINCGTPGWGTPSNGQNLRTATNVYGFDHLYQVKLDGSGQVRSFAFARGVVDSAYYTAIDKDVYAASSRGGSKILFKSRNLANTNTSTRDGHLYVAEWT